MIDYRRNYLTTTDKTTFNLKDHTKYLNIILAKPGITCDMVFTRESGHQYFKNHNIPLILYKQGLLKPLPHSSSSQWFPEKEVVGIRHIMVVVTCPSGKNITDDDSNCFDRTCLMGLWACILKRPYRTVEKPVLMALTRC